MIAKNLICLMVLLVMLAGCSAKATLNDDLQPRAAETPKPFFKKTPSDQVLFDEALLLFKKQNKEEHYQEAKDRLQKLVEQYPDSKWAESAQVLLLALNNIFALETALKNEKQKTQGEQAKLGKEIKELKDSVQQIEEKYTADIGRLQQENEQLKNDIQQLKNLEIRLEKREKMLR